MWLWQTKDCGFALIQEGPKGSKQTPVSGVRVLLTQANNGSAASLKFRGIEENFTQYQLTALQRGMSDRHSVHS